MKYVTLALIMVVAGCVDAQLQDHLEAERDFHAHQAYMESVYNLDNYDPEYVADCFYYEEMVCPFE